MSLSQPGISFSVWEFLTCLSVHVSATARDIILCQVFHACLSVTARDSIFCVKVFYLSLSPCLCHSRAYHSLCQVFHAYLSVTARDIIFCVKVSYLSLGPCLCHSRAYHSLCQVLHTCLSVTARDIYISMSRFLTCLSLHVYVTARDIMLCVNGSYLSLSTCLCHTQWYHYVSRFLTCLSVNVFVCYSHGYHTLCQVFLICLSVTARDIILCIKVFYLSLSPHLCHSQGYHSLCLDFFNVSQSMSLSQPGISCSVSGVSYLFLSSCLCHSQGYLALCQVFLTCLAVHFTVTARDIIFSVRVS